MKTTSMKKTELGEQPAFPFNEIELTTYSGLTKREMFAMAALKGVSTDKDVSIEECAKISVMMADALLKELDK